MIKVFQKFRLKTFRQSKVGSYLGYAFGEIALVVIGILLALQINNWNENRQNRNKEKLILQELHQEMLQNREQLDIVLNNHRNSFHAADKLFKLMPIHLKDINKDSIYHCLYFISYTYTYNPSQTVINSMVNNSSFNIISNDTLRKLLIGWKDLVEDYQEEEIRATTNYINHLKPYEKKHFIYPTLELEYSSLDDPRVNLSFLESLEFENYVRDRWVDINNIIGPDSELKQLQYSLDKIIELSARKGNL